MTNKQRLREVRKRLASESHWTKGAAARNNARLACPPNGVKAVCWCLSAACALEGVTYLFAQHYFGGLHNDPSRQIINFNDDMNTTHKHILKALDKAIRKCDT